MSTLGEVQVCGKWAFAIGAGEGDFVRQHPDDGHEQYLTCFYQECEESADVMVHVACGSDHGSGPHRHVTAACIRHAFELGMELGRLARDGHGLGVMHDDEGQ